MALAFHRFLGLVADAPADARGPVRRKPSPQEPGAAQAVGTAAVRSQPDRQVLKVFRSGQKLHFAAA